MKYLLMGALPMSGNLPVATSKAIEMTRVIEPLTAGQPRVVRQWHLLHRSLLVFSLCALISGGLLYYGYTHTNQAEKAYQNERMQLEKHRRDYQAATQARQLYQAYIGQFRQFVARGYIGEEQRLLWVEAIRAINRQLQLPVLKYTMSPSRVFALADSTPPLPPQFTMHESTIKLELGLLHAGDLNAFLAALKQRAKGLFEVRECYLTLAFGAVHFDTEKANVNAVCQLSWYTLSINN